MIKIGDGYFRENQIAAILTMPDIAQAHVFLLSGQAVVVTADTDSLHQMLMDTGLLSPGPAVEVLTFTPKERQELRLVYEDGYLFVAKDRSGQVYAYKHLPKKWAGEWTDSKTDDVWRLHGEFECLSFEDDEPLSLVDLFQSEGAEDE